MEIFQDSVWQMSLGERAALEGLLSQLRPELAIEIGTAQGASLRRICAHAREVHSFDLVEPSLEIPENAVIHTGDSHTLLPQVLEDFARAGRNVDFALVDGDHSADGARQDVEHLLDSDAIQRSYIVMHDTTNAEVRRGLDAVRYAAWPKVARVELDWITGLVFREETIGAHLWGGLGLVIVDAARPAYGTTVMPEHLYPNGPLLAEAHDWIATRERDEAAQRSGELDALRVRVAELERRVQEAERAADLDRRARHQLETSASWRLTRPLRTTKARARRLLT